MQSYVPGTSPSIRMIGGFCRGVYFHYQATERNCTEVHPPSLGSLSSCEEVVDAMAPNEPSRVQFSAGHPWLRQMRVLEHPWV